MNGKDLYTNFVSKRDNSGSAADEYAQLLMTIMRNIGTLIYPLLEQANAENKKLSIKSNSVEFDELTTSDITFI